MVSRSVSRSVSRHVATTASEQPWLPPDTPKHFDYINDRYSTNGVPARLNDISEFIRLSSATKWQDGQLVEVANNVPRISGDGLLIEPQRTNRVPSFLYWINPSSGARDVLRTIDTFTFSNSDRQKGAIHVRVESVTSVKSVYVQASEGGEAWLQAGGERYDRYTLSASQVRRYKTPPLTANAWGVLAPLGQNTLSYPQDEDGDQVTSYIPVGENPTTRAPDILNIPLLPTQTLSGDWDAGVTYEVADNIATFTGHGYIRNITMEAL